MALPWVAAIAVEWLVLRRFFATDLVGRSDVVVEAPPAPVRVFALTVVALTLAGFFVTSALDISPVACCADSCC